MYRYSFYRGTLSIQGAPKVWKRLDISETIKDSGSQFAICGVVHQIKIRSCMRGQFFPMHPEGRERGRVLLIFES